jgi:hypothetical protein
MRYGGAMKEVYSIAIDRPGLADLPELVRTEDPAIAGEVVRALLAAHDPAIACVVVRVSRMASV